MEHHAETPCATIWVSIRLRFNGPTSFRPCDLFQELGESRKFDQIIVNEYLPGQGISSDVDSVVDFGPTFVSLSLLSAVCMQFQGVETKQVEELCLEPLSLLVLRQEARYRWTHAIPSRKSDKIGDQRVWRQRRISLTFRTLS